MEKFGIQWLSVLRPQQQVNLLRGWEVSPPIAKSSYNRPPADLLLLEYPSISTFLDRGFVWSGSQEGHAHWSGLSARLSKIEQTLLAEMKQFDSQPALGLNMLSHMNRDNQFAFLKNLVNISKLVPSKYLLQRFAGNFIASAFTWSDSPEGTSHWNELNKYYGSL